MSELRTLSVCPMRGEAASGKLCRDEERDPPRGGPQRMTFNLGVVLALACAALTQLAFLCKHRGANAVADIDLRRPLMSARQLMRSKWFALGMLVAAGGWLLHVAALTLAPLST